MAHSDDRGLILPPKLAPTEAVIVPIYSTADDKTRVMEQVGGIEGALKGDFRIKVDDREQFTPGWKYADAELHGIPVRIEVGPKDVAKDQAVLVRRDNREKAFVPLANLTSALKQTLKLVHTEMLEKALKFRDENTRKARDYESFQRVLDGEGGFIWANWCGDEACETKVKEETKATIRVLPFDQTSEDKGPCLVCGRKSPHHVVWSRAY
jgi:prolyl-tRNA synthetase